MHGPYEVFASPEIVGVADEAAAGHNPVNEEDDKSMRMMWSPVSNLLQSIEQAVGGGAELDLPVLLSRVALGLVQVGVGMGDDLSELVR